MNHKPAHAVARARHGFGLHRSRVVQAVAASGILLLFGSNVLLALLTSTPAQAASCPAGADTWTGGSGPTAFWGSPSNWSLGFAPTATVQACINSGTPIVTDVFQVAGITMTGGGLSITGGSLEIADTSFASTINDLNMSGGILQADTGPAQLAVTLTGSNSWTAGELAGNVLGASLATSGTDSLFVVDQTATLIVSGPNASDALLPQIGPGTGLHNNGLLDWNAGFFCVSGDGLSNESLGTIEINGTTPDQMIDCNLSGATVTNNGSVSVTAPLDGGFPAIYNDFTNNGTLAVATALSFGGNVSASATSIFAPSLTAAGNGFINLNGGTEAVGGTIQPAVATGFVPSAGEQFQVISCDGGCTGSYPPTQDGFTVLDSGTSISLEAEPATSLSPTTLTFNPTLVGSGSGPLAVTVTNTGSATLTVTSDVVTGTDAPDFPPSPGGDSCSGATIAPQGSCSVALDFSPAGGGARAATLQITDDAPGSPQAVALSGTGEVPAAGLGFSPNPIDFGPVPVGATSEVTETLTNSGNVALYPQFSVTGTDTSPFSMVPGTNCQGSEGGLPPAATCSVALTFTPSGPGPVPADLVVTDGSGAGNWTVPIFATGTAFAMVSLSPASLTFGSAPVGTPVGPVTVTATNTGNGTLYFTSLAQIGGADPADFSLTSDGCAATGSSGVAPGGQCTEHVTFTPQAPGPRSGSLIFTDNATGSPQTVPVSGTGTAAAVSFGLNPIAFPATPVGTAATTPLTETITNSGTAPLIISAATLTGATPGDFGLASNTCSGATVAPAGNCTLVFTFTPTAAGQRAATLSVADNVTGSPQTVPITGSGTLPAATIGPSTLPFPATTIGNTSGPLVVTVASSGTAPLTVRAVSISGPDAADFAIASDSCTAGPLSPGASCSIGITFTPAAAGNRTATLAIAGNAPGGSGLVGLSGPGTAAPVPSILLSLNPISFPVTSIGNQGLAQLESLTDSGSAPLAITGVAVSGLDQADFAIVSDSCSGATLRPGASCSISVSFIPGGAGPRSAQLVVTSNAPGGPSSVGLTGTGTAPIQPVVVTATTPPPAPQPSPSPSPSPSPAQVKALIITRTPTPAPSTPAAPAAPGAPAAPAPPPSPGPSPLAAGAPAQVPPSPNFTALSLLGLPYGPAGSGLNTIVHNYPAGCTEVYFFFGSTRIGSAPVSAAGQASASGLSVPGNAQPGTYSITSSCTSSGSPVVLSAGFRVTQGLHRSAFVTSLNPPGNAAHTVRSYALSAALAALILALLAFPSQIFNATLQEHYEEVRRWFHLNRPLSEVVGDVNQRVLFPIMLVVGGLLFALITPDFGFNLSTLALATGLAIAVAVITVGFATPTYLYFWRTYNDRGQILVMPGTIIVGAACVLVSRLAHFQPGYLYGLLAIFVFHHESSEETDGKLAAASALMVLVLALLCWIFRIPLTGLNEKHPSFLALVGESALSGAFVLGVESVIVGLLPMRFLDGSRIKKWSTPAWAALFVLAVFVAIQILLQPGSGYVGHATTAGRFTVLSLYFAFALFSIAFWAYFRYRTPKAGEEELDTEGDYEVR